MCEDKSKKKMTFCFLSYLVIDILYEEFILGNDILWIFVYYNIDEFKLLLTLLFLIYFISPTSFNIITIILVLRFFLKISLLFSL